MVRGGPENYEYDSQTGFSKEGYLNRKYCTRWGTPLVDLAEYKKGEIFALTSGSHEWYNTYDLYVVDKDFTWKDLLDNCDLKKKTKDSYLQVSEVVKALASFAHPIQGWKELNVTA